MLSQQEECLFILKMLAVQMQRSSDSLLLNAGAGKVIIKIISLRINY